MPVIAVQACAPKSNIVFISACTPAPPPESDAAIVHTIGGGVLLETFFID